MRIAIVTDAWLPQVNGVVRTLQTLTASLEAMGDEVIIISPDQFFSMPCPTYPEIRLAIFARGGVHRMLDEFQPDAIHLATEGPLGWFARGYCLKRNLPFTTAYHTRFPEYVKARTGIPLSISYAVVRRFHKPSSCVMTATESLREDLRHWGFERLGVWTRGINTELFRPTDESLFDLPRPVSLYVGRVAVEKNIRAFLDLDLPGSKVVVGDGPQLDGLKQAYPDIHFLGKKEGEDLAQHYASADVFVFPSLTDTFGLVLLEALASGVPVAAFPVCGPLDVVGDEPVGALSNDLGEAVRKALDCDREKCRAYALDFSWETSVNQFRGNLQELPQKALPAE